MNVDVTIPATNAPSQRRRPDLAALAIATIVFAALSTWLSLASAGFLEADGVTHYLYARYAFDTPAYFVDVWARPMRMLLHAVPAHYFGLAGVRAASLAAAIATAWITYAIARRLGWPLPALAGLFVLAQPLFFLHSFSELTEVPFALLGAIAFHSLVARRWWLFAIVCGTMPASRPEGAGFLLLAIALLIANRRWWWLPLTLLPTLVWNHLGWTLWGEDAGVWWRWLIDRFPYSSKSLYDAGPIWRFVAVLPFVVSPLVVPAVLIGTLGIARARAADATRGTTVGRWTLPDEWLVALLPWGILAVHSLLHATGRMSSSGEPRYLLAAAPFWALLACRGWSMMSDRFHWRRPVLFAGLAALVPVAANIAYPVVPLRPQPDAILCQQFVQWYDASGLRDRYPTVYATHPLVYFYLDAKIEGVTRDIVRDPPPGVMFVYDSLYGSYNSDVNRTVTPAMFEAAGWTVAPDSEQLSLPTQTWRIYLSPKPAP